MKQEYNTLLLLNPNILKYVLNPYLFYNSDISKIIKVTAKAKINFDIKPHLLTKYGYYNQNIIKWKKTYIDNKLYTYQSYDITGGIIYRKEYKFNKLINEQRYLNNIKISENNIKNDKLYGKSYSWDDNGNLNRILTFYNDLFHGTQVYYKDNKLIELREYRYGVILKWIVIP